MRNNVNPDGSTGEAGGRDGILYRLDPDRRVTIHRKDLGISNTLAWSPNHRRFYFGDTLANTVWSYDYHPTTGGYLWNCRFFGGCIVRVAPDGRIDRIVEMPVQNITTCTFGGPNLKTLYITTAMAEAPAGDRLAGGLYALESEVPGQPENRFCAFR